MKTLLLIVLLSSFATKAWAEKPAKGLLPELKLDQTNEDANQKKAVQSEVLITKSETKAIAALNAVLKKKKGSPVEADLWYRMAELYMRRAKSGRFFDLSRGQEDSAVKFAPPEVRDESATNNLKQAISIYNKIERDFPRFGEMDSVFFNNAFASQQVGRKKNADLLYARMVDKFPRSALVPDAHLALGEMQYEGGNFAIALDHFRAIEKFPKSRVYSYGLYKQAWTHYNLKQNEDGIQKLIQVVKYFAPENKGTGRVTHDLRAEALRDLALFFGETHPASDAYGFFAKICNEDEIGDAMINLGKLYDSHSRQKEMNVFLGEYIEKHPQASNRVKAELLLIQGNETLKNRPEVVNHMMAAAEVCRPASPWRVAHATTSEAECDYDLAKANLDMAKKWWEIWLKNKTSKAMAELTEKAFKIHLDREDPKKPDAKSHYAYAELLFQQEKFRDSSIQYEFAATNSQDTQIAHDAAYSSIVSLEKVTGKETTPEDSARLMLLSQNYLKKYPQGPQATQVQYKMGFIAYEAKNYGEAEKWLKPLAMDPKQDASLRTRSQDLMLDILNARQDLNGIRDFAKGIMASTDNVGRKKNLQKIMQEADYNSIQKSIDGSKDAEVDGHIKQLLGFYHDNKDTSSLAKTSLSQAMALAFTKGKSMQGASMALEFAKAYPQDNATTDALREAAKHYNEQGFLLKAAAVLELLAQRVKGSEQAKIDEAVSEIYTLENRKADAREFLGKLLQNADKKEQGKLYSRLLSTYKGEENSAEYAKLESKILSLNVQPTASEIQVKRVEALFQQKKYTEAFNHSKSLVGGDAPKDIRARARIVQARVLETEMVQQSTKTTIDRLPLVLSLKTEKLDKAQTAYLTASKMSDDANVQLASLEGLARLYKNYSEGVGNPVIRSAMKDDEKKALSDELAKLVNPIKEKQVDIDAKLKALAKAEKTATTGELDFSTLPVSESVKPRIPEVGYERIGMYLPHLTQAEGLFVEREKLPSKASCIVDEKTLSLGLGELMTQASLCLALKKFSQIEKLATSMAEISASTGVAPYYLSLAASGLGQKEKSLYLIELALKKTADKSFFWYQKALALGMTGDRAQANQLMIKAFDEHLDAWETRVLHGVVAFSQGDCYSLSDDFKGIPAQAVDQYQLLPALSECMAQKGEIEPAVALIQKAMTTQKSLVLALQLGHLAEVYKTDSKLALVAYEKARVLAKDPSTQEWLTNKLKWINNPQSVTESDSLHVIHTVARKEMTGDGQ